MHQNILVLAIKTLNGARLGLRHLANKEPNLLGTGARAGVKRGDLLKLSQPTARLLFCLSMHDRGIRLTGLDNARNQLQHPGAVVVTDRADTKLLDQHQFILHGIPGQDAHRVTALKKLPAHGCRPAAGK